MKNKLHLRVLVIVNKIYIILQKAGGTFSENALNPRKSINSIRIQHLH